MTITQDVKTTFAHRRRTSQSSSTSLASMSSASIAAWPVHLLSALERMRGVTDKPLSAQPNAGLPRDVQGRQFYMGSRSIWRNIAALLCRRCEVRRRLLRHDADAHQAHRRIDPLVSRGRDKPIPSSAVTSPN